MSLQGVANDAAKTRVAKLQAQLQEKEEDLKETRYDHQLEIQQQGYEKLSEDMQKTLDDAVQAINGNHEELMKVANAMLKQLETNGVDESGVLDKIINESQTQVGDAAKDVIHDMSDAYAAEMKQKADEAKAIAQQAAARLINAKATAAESRARKQATQAALVQATTQRDAAAASLQNIQEQKAAAEAAYQNAKANYENTKRQIANGKDTEEMRKKREIQARVLASQQQILAQLNSQEEVAKEALIIATEGEASARQNVSVAEGYEIKMQERVKEAQEAAAIANENMYKANQEAAAAGISGLLDRIGVEAVGLEMDIANAIKDRPADEAVSQINPTIDVTSGDVKDIEDWIRTEQRTTVGIEKSKEGQDRLETEAEEKRKKEEEERLKKEAEAKRKAEAEAEAERQRQAAEAERQRQAAEAARRAAEEAAYAEVVRKRQQLDQAVTEFYKWHNKIQADKNNKNVATWRANRKAAADIIRSLGGQVSVAANGTITQMVLPRFAKGSKNIDKDKIAWTSENGDEMIVRPSDNAILTPLKANDAVIPANLVDNLFKWGAINPDSFATNPFMGKWGDAGSGKAGGMFSNNTNTQNVDVHFDSLITVQGNVDSDVVGRLEDLSKSLTSNKDFQQNVIKFVTKDFVKESRKLGMR